jgi:hypothetical protein
MKRDLVACGLELLVVVLAKVCAGGAKQIRRPLKPASVELRMKPESQRNRLP